MTAPPPNDSAPPSYPRLIGIVGLLAMGVVVLNLAVDLFWPGLLPSPLQRQGLLSALLALSLGCSALQARWSVPGARLRPAQRGGADMPQLPRSRLGVRVLVSSLLLLAPPVISLALQGVQAVLPASEALQIFAVGIAVVSVPVNAIAWGVCAISLVCVARYIPATPCGVNE
jgi:hypothetical protein